MKSTSTKVLLLAAVIFGFFWLLAAAPPMAAEKATGPEDEKHPEADFSISCLECHQEVTPEVTEEWNSGKHGLLNVGCFVCHGDGEVEFYPKPASFNCIGCHSAQEVDFEQVEATSCFSCHDGHDLKFHM